MKKHVPAWMQSIAFALAAPSVMAQSAGDGPVNALPDRTLEFVMSTRGVQLLNDFGYYEMPGNPNRSLMALGDATVHTEATPRSWLLSASMSTPLDAASAFASSGLPSRVSASGGMVLDVSVDDTPSSYGRLALTNWTIDATTRRVLVDVEGDVRIGRLEDVAFFELGPMAVQSGEGGYAAGTTSFESMVFTPEGVDLFVRALGVSDFRRALIPTTSIGTLSVGVAMTPVPESATWALMLMGLVGLGGVMARQHRKA